MRRVGFIGTENSHTDHFIRFLNVEQRFPDFRAVALAGGDNERNQALARAGGIDLVVDEPDELLDRVDVAVITTRDGARHREQAEPLLRAGIPVLVDKPLATTVADARAMIDAANAGGAVLESGSALRFVPQIAELGEDRDNLGDLRRIDVIGPADPDSEYSGLFFYGIHQVEAAFELLGNPVVPEHEVECVVRRDLDTTVALVRAAEVTLVFTFVTPGEAGRMPFHATVAGTTGVRARELVLDRDYNAPLLERFVRAVETETPSTDYARLLSPVAVLQAVTAALGGIGGA